MRTRTGISIATVSLLAFGTAAVASHAAEGRFNTPMAGKTEAKGEIGSNYQANTRKLRNLSLDWGCQETDDGKPVYTSASKFTKVYATVSRTGKLHAVIETNYGAGEGGVFEESLGKATITIDGKLKSRPGKVTGAGTVSVKTAQCESGKLKFSWKGKNGT